MAAISLRLPTDISMRLQQLSERTGRSKTFYMIEAIQDRLDDLEDLYIAERELEEIRAGRSVTMPLAEVMARHGMVS
jgi:RHH-type transcriptional regulator, rel operon repressor / antitoxin RelB